MGGSSKSSSSNNYDYSQSEEYTSVQGGQLGILGNVSGKITVTDQGAVDAAAAISQKAMDAAEKNTREGLNAAVRLAEGSYGLVDGITGLVGGIGENYSQLASESQRLAADNTQAALDYAKEVGRPDGGQVTDIAKYLTIGTAFVTAAYMLSRSK